MKKPKWNPKWDIGSSNGRHIEQAYTDYLEARRDGVQRLEKKLDRESKRDSKPEWDKWTDTSTVTLWEAIALSLNVEPEKLQCLRRYPLPPWLDFDECPKEFRRRLAIAKKRVSELAANSENSNPIEKTKVILSRLRIMSEKLKKPWKFPKDFPASFAPETNELSVAERIPGNKTASEPIRRNGEPWTDDQKEELVRLKDDERWSNQRLCQRFDINTSNQYTQLKKFRPVRMKVER